MRRVSSSARAGSAPADPDDALDVPAAIICATCGSPECAGCTPPVRVAPEGGGVPWETEQGAGWSRLWTTARRSVVDGRSFFGALSGGTLANPLLFALACELLAIGSLVAAWGLVGYVVWPELFTAVWSARRWALVAFVLASILAMAVIMVFLHLVWGAGLGLGLRLQGEAARFAHIFRYALYSCGWDLLTSPFGLAVGAFQGGARRAWSETRQAVRIPREATRAYLLDSRHLSDEQARRAVRVAAVLTGALVLLGGAFVIFLVVVASLVL